MHSHTLTARSACSADAFSQIDAIGDIVRAEVSHEVSGHTICGWPELSINIELKTHPGPGMASRMGQALAKALHCSDLEELFGEDGINNDPAWVEGFVKGAQDTIEEAYDSDIAKCQAFGK